MQVFNFILNVAFSVLFVSAPILGIHSELNHQNTYDEMCCNMQDMDDDGQCCALDNMHDPHKNKGNCKDKCSDHASHVSPQTIQSPVQTAQKPSSLILVESDLNNYYQDLSLQSTIFQFWNPPKCI